MPDARRTRSPVCKGRKQKARECNHRYAETFRHSLRDGFTAYDALSPVSGLF